MQSYNDPDKSKETITISTNLGREKIHKQQIISCKEYIYGTLVYLEDNSHYLLKEDIPELKTILDEDDFFVLNELTLVNLRFVEAIFKRKVLMKNGQKYNIDPRRKKELLKRIEKFYVL